MTKLLQDNEAFVKLLASTKTEEQMQALLDTVTPSPVHAISKIALNILNKCCGLPDEDARRRVNENIDFFRKFATAERPFELKRNFLACVHEVDTNHNGDGIFSVLLPLLGGILPALLGK